MNTRGFLGRRRSRWDSHYAMGLQEERRDLYLPRKENRRCFRRPLSTRVLTMLDAEAASSSSASCTFTWVGVHVYRYRFPPAGIIRLCRSSPPRSVLFSPFSHLAGVLLPAYCEKTAFSTLEVATRRELNSSSSFSSSLATINDASVSSRGRSTLDAPDYACRIVAWVAFRVQSAILHADNRRIIITRN